MKIKYTEEQKQNAVQMLMEQGPHKPRDTLGIPTNTLYRWKKQLTGEAVSDDDTEISEICDAEDEVPEEDIVVPEYGAIPEGNPEAEEQPRKPATLPEIEAVISKYFTELLEKTPEICINPIATVMRNLFKENENLTRENARLRRTLRAMLEE